MKSTNKAAKFFRRNAYYLILVASLLVVATIVVTAIVLGTRPRVTPPVNQPDPPQTILPMTPLANYELHGGYAVDELVYSTTLKLWQTHGAIDLKAERGTEVVSILDGKVTKASSNPLDGYFVVITHANGLVSTYKSLDKQLAVKEGDNVTRGQKIGLVSDTMMSEIKQGPHLHFELSKDGETVNPVDYLDALGGK